MSFHEKFERAYFFVILSYRLERHGHLPYIVKAQELLGDEACCIAVNDPLKASIENTSRWVRSHHHRSITNGDPILYGDLIE